MKKVFLAIVLVLTMAGAALAAGSATVDVSATVVPSCGFITGSTTLAFGNLDPAVGGNGLASGTLQFWCTTGTVVGVSDDKAGVYSLTGPDTITYSVAYTPAGVGAGYNNPIDLAIDGTIAEADWISKPAGVYTDTITVSINP